MATAADEPSNVNGLVLALRQALRALHGGQPPFDANPQLEVALHQLLVATQSRAVGLWLCYDQHLHLLGFQGAADMPAAVSQGFRQATSWVPLTEMGLGIVQAAVRLAPSVSLRAPHATNPHESATWLARFDARQSLAVPIVRQAVVVGVLAMSTAQPLAPQLASWQLLESLAADLAPSFPTPVRP